MKKPIRPAATVVVIKETQKQPKILLLRRNPEIIFAGNNWVFPGGKVEADDIAKADGDIDKAYQFAAIRECQEETALTIDTASLYPISHWTTPSFRSKRYATQFYVSCLNGSSNVVVDGGEIVEFQWLRASDAIAKHQCGDLELMPPTLVTLSELALHDNYQQIMHYYNNRLERQYNPRVKQHENIEGKPHATFLYEGDSGYLDTNPERRDCLNRCVLRNGVIEHLCNLD